MMSAKEWAAEVVLAVMTEDRNNNSVERLAERVQADARAPLEEELARLRAENEKLRRVAFAARDICLMYDWDMNAPGPHEKDLAGLIGESGLAHLWPGKDDHAR